MPLCWPALAPSAVELPAMARGLPLLRWTMRWVPGAGPLLLPRVPLRVKYSTVSVKMVLPDFAVDSCRYTRLPVAGAVKVTGWVTREPSGTVRVVLPDATTVPVGLSSRAVQVRPTEVSVRSSLKTVMLRVTVALWAELGTACGRGKVPLESELPEADQYGRSTAATGLNAACTRWICGLLHGSGRLSAP